MSGQAWTLHEASPEDAEEIVAYCNRIGGESDNLSFGANAFHYSVSEQREVMRRMSATGSGVSVLARNAAGEVVGMSVALSKGRRSAHVFGQSVTVRKDHWRRGIGDSLMRRIIELARNIGCLKMSLRVRSDNESAMALYLKHGFLQEGVQIREVLTPQGEFKDLVCFYKLLQE